MQSEMTELLMQGGGRHSRNTWAAREPRTSGTAARVVVQIEKEEAVLCCDPASVWHVCARKTIVFFLFLNCVVCIREENSNNIYTQVGVASECRVQNQIISPT